MLPLRYPILWLAVGWILVFTVVSGSLAPAPVINALFSFNDKLMHAGSYFVLTIWFAGLYRRGYHWAIGGVLFALGVALDVLQLLTATRQLDWHDMVANGVGILAALLLSRLLLEGWCERVERRLLT